MYGKACGRGLYIPQYPNKKSSKVTTTHPTPTIQNQHMVGR
jgi:hypothetical protein